MKTIMQQDIFDKAGEFLALLKDSQCSVVLTGAGVSTGSGIPDFRSTHGLFSKISQRTFEINYFFSEPLKYYQTAIEHIHSLADKTPNPTHEMLAQLEQAGLIQGIVTQNIDRLHQKAGSKRVVEFHGDVVSFHCTSCHKAFDRATVEASTQKDMAPYCPECDSLIRPGITFYGDPINPKVLEAAYDLTERSDLFIVMGSSLTVNPAATLAGMATRQGAKLIILNLESTPYDHLAEAVWHINLDAFSQAVKQAMA